METSTKAILAQGFPASGPMGAPHAHMQETLLTSSRPLGVTELGYILTRGSGGYFDTATIVSISCTAGHTVTDEQVIEACASLRLRHPIIASKVSFSSPTFPELVYAAPLTQGHTLRQAKSQIEFHTFDDKSAAVDALRDHWLATDPHDALDIREQTCSFWWGKGADADRHSGKYIFGIRTTHLINDGRRQLNLVRCFLELVAEPGRALKEIAAHFAGKIPPVELPPALDRLLPDLRGCDPEERVKAKAAFDELVKFRSKPLSGLVPDGPGSEDTLEARFVCNVWTPEESARILKRCKAHGVTITTLVNVASALASVQRTADGAISGHPSEDDPYYFEFSQALDINAKVPRLSNSGEVETAVRIITYPIVICVPRSTATEAKVKHAVWDVALQFQQRTDDFVKSPYFWHFIEFYLPMRAEVYLSHMAGKPFMPYMSSLGDVKSILPTRYPVRRAQAEGDSANGSADSAEVVIEDAVPTIVRVDPQVTTSLLYTFHDKLQLQLRWNAGRTSDALMNDWFGRVVEIVSQASADVSA